MKAGTVILRPGRERTVLRWHPWVFSGAVERVDGNPVNGDIVDVQDARGNWLARGYFNHRSQIIVRLLTWDAKEEIGTDFWQRRLEQAIAKRQNLLVSPHTTACRLVHAESDGLPGLVVDRYGDTLVMQFLTLGVDRRRAELVSLLADLLTPRTLYERSDVDVREKEGLPLQTGLLWGDELPARLEIIENGIHFWVDVRGGQKTGFYLDQRENRARVREFCAGAEVLDAYAYTGAFGVYAAVHGAARVTFVESSSPALALARENLALNGQDPTRHEFVEGDVPRVLREYRAAGRRFDLIVLDPPKFAPSAQDVPRAARAYKDVNLLAFQLLRPGGILFSTSCSGAISSDLFQKILFGAALDARREVQIIGYLHQASDHPVVLTFPEGAYLKGFICRVA